MRTWDEAGEAAHSVARRLTARLGAPSVGVVLGSGFSSLAEALGCGEAVPLAELPEAPPSRVAGHGCGIAAASRTGGVAWVFLGRWHAYEGLGMADVVFPVRVLREAGAASVLLTCAAGGLRDDDAAGCLAVVEDHVNLVGDDPVAWVPPDPREPRFLDLHDVYDPPYRDVAREAAARLGAPLRGGVLAAVRGPCYETPAEVRMLRSMGADLVSMSTVPEAIAARYLGLRVAALACVSNRGAGLDGARRLRHGDVIEAVRASVRRWSDLSVAIVDAMMAD